MAEKRKLFDEMADDSLEKRKILNGESTNINNFNQIKYKWSSPLYKEMVSNYWVPEIISLSSDKTCYATQLTKEEKRGFDETLSFLIFLDSIQATALPSLSEWITAPEISRIMTLQAYQEIVHSQAYSYILESICDNEEIPLIYYKFKENEMLLSRCRQLTVLYSNFIENPNNENLAKMIITSLMLEGILFYSGFYFFYNLAYNGKMSGTVDEIRLINRDEVTHLNFFVNVVKEIKNEIPGFFTQKIINEVSIPIVELEKAWAIPVYGTGIPGITTSTINDLVNHRIWVICEEIGFTSPFPFKENPYKHLEAIGTDTGENIKTGFFETRLTSYDFATTMDGWEKI
jgi:ribonucleoside-diphosphate reductase beta chain